MTRLDAIERYGVTMPVACDFCFFGIMVAGLCTRCDGRDAVDKSFRQRAMPATNTTGKPQVGGE